MQKFIIILITALIFGLALDAGMNARATHRLLNEQKPIQVRSITIVVGQSQDATALMLVLNDLYEIEKGE